MIENFGGRHIRELKLTLMLPAITVPEATITVPDAEPGEIKIAIAEKRVT